MMNLKTFKYAISSFFLIAFLFVKVVGAHGFIHFSDDTAAAEECNFCEDFLVQNTTPLIFDDTTDFELTPHIIFPELSIVYHYNYYNKSISYNFYNKPPPHSV